MSVHASNSQEYVIRMMFAACPFEFELAAATCRFYLLMLKPCECVHMPDVCILVLLP